MTDGTNVRRKFSCRKEGKTPGQSDATVMRRDVSLRPATILFQFTYSKSKDRGNIAKIHNSTRRETKTKYAGHPQFLMWGGGAGNKICLPG